jgi:hypothetical protein
MIGFNPIGLGPLSSRPVVVGLYGTYFGADSGGGGRAFNAVAGGAPVLQVGSGCCNTST